MRIRRKLQFRAYLAAAILAGCLLVLLASPENQSFHSLGQMNTGHQKIQCDECHKSAQGTFRQQLQANVKFLMGVRRQLASVGYNKVDTKVCVSCHERPTDSHPVYRFNEPKFSVVRKKIKPHLCVSCHQEHQNKRVTIAMDFCQHCHEKLTIKNDKISVSHAKLVKSKRWRTCLGCHDFHGNHKMKLNRDVKSVISGAVIKRYFNGALSPYSRTKKFKAKRPDQ